jgi:transcriptional regulator with XRE-family HTH domain
MPEFVGPMMRRWELGSALRRIREERGMTIAEVTDAMRERYGSGFSTTKLSRMETARRTVIPRDVHDLCLLYEVADDERDQLVELAKAAHKLEMPRSDEAHRGYLWYIALEQVALKIREYSAFFMPGLLQTNEYAAVVENLQFVAPDYYNPRLEPEEVPENAADRVKMRMERQALLDRADPLELHAIVDESALYRRLPNHEVMREQLRHVIEMSKRTNIIIQVMPFEAGLYPGSECSYWSILDFQDGAQQPPTTVYAEAASGVQILDREPEVMRLTSAFTAMSALALTPEASRELIERTIAR